MLETYQSQIIFYDKSIFVIKSSLTQKELTIALASDI